MSKLSRHCSNVSNVVHLRSPNFVRNTKKTSPISELADKSMSRHAIFKTLVANDNRRTLHTTKLLFHGHHSRGQKISHDHDHDNVTSKTNHIDSDAGHGHSHGGISSMFGHSHGKPSDVHIGTGEGPTTRKAGEFSPEAQEKEMKITKLGLYSNIGLTILKAIAGVMGNSVALIADALHSVSDMVSDGATIFTIKHSSAPADTDHPYGHGRIEDIGTLGVSSIVVLTGLGIGWHSCSSMIDLLLTQYPTLSSEMLQTLPSMVTDTFGLSELVHNHAASTGHGHSHAIETDERGIPTMLALSVAVGSVLVKELLYRMTMNVAKDTGSRIVEINAWHHRSDALSSLIAVVGVGGAMMSMPLLDPLAGLFVAGLITKQGADMAIEVFHDITDKQLPAELLESLTKAALACKAYGIMDVSLLRGRKMGRYMIVDATVTVPSTFSVSAAHQAAEAVRSKILQTHEGITEVNVHVDVDGDLCTNAYTNNHIISPQDLVNDIAHPSIVYAKDPQSATSDDLTSNPSSTSTNTGDKEKGAIRSSRSTSSTTPKLMRPYSEVEDSVRHTIASIDVPIMFKDRITVSQIICHYVREKLSVSVNLAIDISQSSAQDSHQISLSDLNALGQEIEHALVHEIDDIVGARVCVVLTDTTVNNPNLLKAGK